jgi:hypothetical protein
MTLLDDIAEWSFAAFALLLLLAQLLAKELGFVYGRHRAKEGHDQAEGAGLVVAGMLGLLGIRRSGPISSVPGATRRCSMT